MINLERRISILERSPIPRNSDLPPPTFKELWKAGAIYARAIEDRKSVTPEELSYARSVHARLEPNPIYERYYKGLTQRERERDRAGLKARCERFIREHPDVIRRLLGDDSVELV